VFWHCPPGGVDHSTKLRTLDIFPDFGDLPLGFRHVPNRAWNYVFDIDGKDISDQQDYGLFQKVPSSHNHGGPDALSSGDQSMQYVSRV